VFRHLVAFTISFFLLINLYSQVPPSKDFSWSSFATLGAEELGNDIALDTAGNVYVIGVYTGSIRFGSLPSLPSIGNEDIFVVKYDKFGNPLWSVRIGGTGEDIGNGIDVDISGNVYITGSYKSSPFQIYGGSNPAIPNSGNSDVFMAKLNGLNGNPIWLRTPTSGANEDVGYRVYTDNTNVYFTGYFVSDVNFGATGNLNSGGGNQEDIFIASYNATTGNLNWARKAVSSNNERGMGITGHGNSIYLAGYYNNGNVVFENSGPNLTLNNIGNDDIYVAKFNKSNGDVVWVNSIGWPTKDERAHDITYENGSVWITGYFTDSTKYFNGIVFDTIVSYGQKDVLTARFDTLSGSIIDIWRDGGTGEDVGVGISKIFSSDLLITGVFENTLRLQKNNFQLNATSAVKDIFILNYSNAGLLNWATQGSGFGIDSVSGICANPKGLAGITGYHRTADLLLPPSFNNPWFAGREYYVGYLNGCNANFTYTKASLCKYIDSPISPTLTGDPSGIYSSTPFGLSLDSLTGKISADSSNAGIYTVCYTAPNNCQTCQSIEIKANCTSFGNGLSSSDFEAAYATAVDEKNKWVYTVGTITNESIFPTITLLEMNGGGGNSGRKDGFVAKYDFTGALLWAFNIGGLDDDEVWDIELDTLGNLYVTGYHKSAITNFTGHSGAASSSNTIFGGADIFTASYTPAGVLRWFKTDGGTNDDFGTSLAVNNHAVYQVGVFDGNGSIGKQSYLGANFQTYIQKFDLNGNEIWTARVSGASDEWNSTTMDESRKLDVTVQFDTAYVIGYTESPTLNFFDKTNTNVLALTEVDNSAADQFVYAIDSASNFIWATRIEDMSGDIRGLAITSDCEGIYITANMHDQGFFPGGDTINSGHDDAYIAKLDIYSGQEVWLDEWNSTSSHLEFFNDIVADGYGNIYATGRYDKPGYNNGDTSLSHVDKNELILVKYQTNGTFEWAQIGTGTDDDWGLGIATYKNENVFICGQYDDDLTFGTTSLTGTTSDDIFLFNVVVTPTGSLVDCCPNLSSVSGNTITGNDTFCIGTIADTIYGSTPSGTEYVYQWQFSVNGSSFTNIITNGSFKDYAPGALSDTTWFRRLLLNGCRTDTIFSDTVLILVNPLPIIDAGNSSTICLGDTAVLQGSGGVNYSWTPITTIINPNQDTTGANPSTTTKYYLHATDINGCAGQDSVVVTVNPLPVISAGPPSTICIGDTALLQGSGGMTYNWTPSVTIFNPTQDTTEANPTTTTKYYLVGTDGNGCSNTDSVVVTVNPLPLVSAGSPSTICDGDTAKLQGSGAQSYSWTPSSTIIFPSQDTTGATPSTTTRYYLVGTDVNGCSNTDSVVVTVNPLPVVSAGSPSTICNGDTALLQGSGGLLYSWSPSSSVVTPSQDTTGAIPSTTTMYYLSVDDVNGCTNHDSVLISVDQLPTTAVTSADTSFCGDSLFLTGSMPLIGTPSWSLHIGGGIVATPNSNNTSYYNMTSGLNVLTYSISNGVCPSSVDSIFITSDTMPSAAWGFNIDTVCLPSAAISLNALISGSLGGFWNGSSGSIISNDSLRYDLMSSGNYSISYKVINGTCADSLSNTVVLLPEYKSAWTVNDTICEATISLGLNPFLSGSSTPGGTWSGPGVVGDSLFASGYGGNLIKIKYEVGLSSCVDSTSNTIYIAPNVDPSWNNSLVDSMCASNPSINLNTLITGTYGGSFSGTGVINDTVFLPSTGQGVYSILYTVGEGNCLETHTQSFYIFGVPVANAGLDKEFCGLNGDLFSIPSIGNGIWSSADSNVVINNPNSFNSSISSLTYGSHIFKWTETNVMCVDSDFVMITFYESLPAPYAGDDQYLNFQTQTTLDAVVPLVGTSQWRADDLDLSFDNVYDEKTVVRNLKAGVNKVLWTYVNGVCPEQSDEVIIYVNDIFIPQGFSPNDDGINDYFVIKGAANVVNSKLEIYNRWGQLLYSANNYRNDWNGQNLSGEKLTNDTYFYIFSGDNINPLNGYIIINR